MSTLQHTGLRLRVSEKFGGTVQGEGPSTGVPACFIRLALCNLICSPCDTPYTWDTTRFDLRKEAHYENVEELLAWALDQPEDLVVVTGGEPLIQMAGLTELVKGLRAAGRTVEIETNGTIAPSEALVAAGPYFNVSPKLSRFGAAMPETRRLVPDVLRAFVTTGRSRFKFVVSEAAELAEIAALEAAYALTDISVMPEGTDPEVILAGMRTLEGPVRERGYRLGTRLHVLLWGDERGR
ncbi:MULTISPECIES: 7-carboxy-7-deazaguanine synthase QueE [Streptomyces]|uniref:7-carboxy-7-deazaguanine synthase n=1 Tax=Streptomyces venezuelae (strain ATCC 10712 / CBS 650.69 / DSM 40230 / JCM 4526 / NBRC 13096 / PD 04745) TaxID=953739 RepID=F2R9E8_STRVP|nr:7-carboxy-7-deazaguanine synthase QueE [Streptomyces venezuelae]APE24531.1 7-carboxy-7-deazaguanine synthase QueE [Streptomyces venezuelae]CCA58991.1 Queuosine Biosynthesis QueE Radical SAM [Streptomyces venezuelae ATCC 10712]